VGYAQTPTSPSQNPPSLNNDELRQIYGVLQDYKLLQEENAAMIEYSQQLRKAVKEHDETVDGLLTVAEGKLKVAQRETEEVTKERDFYKGAYKSLTATRGGFWHTVKRIVTLGIAR